MYTYEDIYIYISQSTYGSVFHAFWPAEGGLSAASDASAASAASWQQASAPEEGRGRGPKGLGVLRLMV